MKTFLDADYAFQNNFRVDQCKQPLSDFKVRIGTNHEAQLKNGVVCKRNRVCMHNYDVSLGTSSKSETNG